LLRDEETAVMLGVSRRTVHSLASSGRLIAIHPAGIRARRFARSDVEALADQWVREAKGETTAK
jgi:excisionase family DNA binding protein